MIEGGREVMSPRKVSWISAKIPFPLCRSLSAIFLPVVSYSPYLPVSCRVQFSFSSHLWPPVVYFPFGSFLLRGTSGFDHILGVSIANKSFHALCRALSVTDFG